VAGQPLRHPAEIRAAGRQRLIRHLAAAGGLPQGHIHALADRALAAASAQQVAVPAERLAASLIRELAQEALACASGSPGWTPTSASCSTATLTRPSSAACPAWGPP